MGHYVDVGLRSSSLCIIDEQGKVCLEREVASEVDEIADAIRGFPSMSMALPWRPAISRHG